MVSNCCILIKEKLEISHTVFGPIAKIKTITWQLFTTVSTRITFTNMGFISRRHIRLLDATNYELIRSDRNRHGGGVACFIRNDLSYNTKSFLSSEMYS